jgi:hypothetical protein
LAMARYEAELPRWDAELAQTHTAAFWMSGPILRTMPSIIGVRDIYHVRRQGAGDDLGVIGLMMLHGVHGQHDTRNVEMYPMEHIDQVPCIPRLPSALPTSARPET